VTLHDATPTPPAALAQRFDLLAADATEYALFLTDPDGRVLSRNPGAERLFGYRADEAVGRQFSRFFSPEDLVAGQPEHELRAARADGVRWQVRRDGSRFWSKATTTALNDETRRVHALARVTHDLTDAQAREAQTRRATPGRERVAAFLKEDTIVIALHGSLTDEERALTRTPARTARVRAFHRQLFADVTDTLARPIRSITGTNLRGTAAGIDLTTTTGVHVLTTDTVLADFLLAGKPTGRPDPDRAAGTNVPKADLKAGARVRVTRNKHDKTVATAVGAGEHPDGGPPRIVGADDTPSGGRRPASSRYA